jgi:mannitol-specific phosphotransferase system IIBC component
MKKQFVIGFILGALLFGTSITLAAEALNVVANPFPVLINSIETQVEGYNIDGFTFLKLADFKKAGLTVKFNETNKQIEITSADSSTAAPSVQQNNISGGTTMSETTTEKITQTPDGITQIDTWDGQQYIGFIYIRNKIKEKGYDIKLFDKSTRGQIIKGEEIILDNIPVTIIFGCGSIEVNYYISTILPLII